MQTSNRTLGLILGLLAVAIFGGSLPATRAAVAGGLDPWFVTAARAGIGGVIGLALLGWWRPRVPYERMRTLALISACLVIGFPAALAIASVSVPSAHGGVILGLLPLASAVGAVAIAGERPSPAFWLLTVAGAALVVAFALRDGSVEIVTGDIFLGAAVVLTGVGYTLSAVLSRTIPGWQVSAWPLVLALPLAAVGCIAMWPAAPASIPVSAWIGVIYSGVMTQFVGYAVWNQALALGGVARIGQLQLLQPFVTFVIAAIFLGETIDATMVGFAVAVVAVVALGRRAAVRLRAS
jgi:drug/metabolite transporter (DMT)-like permease